MQNAVPVGDPTRASRDAACERYGLQSEQLLSRNFWNDVNCNRLSCSPAESNVLATIRSLLPECMRSASTEMKATDGRHWNVHLLFRLGLHGRQTKEIKMRKMIYMAAVAGLAVVGAINASYAAGAGAAGGGVGGAAGGGVGTGSSTGGSSTTGMGTGNTGNGMGNSAGGANAGANSLSNPSGNSLMPNSPGGAGTAVPRSGGRR